MTDEIKRTVKEILTVESCTAVGLSAVDRVVSQRGVGDWCHPGDDNRQRWLLIFDDADRDGFNLYFDEAKAMEDFAKSEGMGWNCHLFSSVPRSSG